MGNNGKKLGPCVRSLLLYASDSFATGLGLEISCGFCSACERTQICTGTHMFWVIFHMLPHAMPMNYLSIHAMGLGGTHQAAPISLRRRKFHKNYKCYRSYY